MSDGDPSSFGSDETVVRDTGFEGQPEERFSPGDVLDDRYRIVALLGRGGMGEVYRAEDMKLGQQVALKFLPRHGFSAGALQRLYEEVRLGRKVSHPNVCRLYDVGEWRGNHFVAMEYIDGEDLASLLRRIGRLPHDKAVDIAQDICAALAAAHGLGVIHRDLKPANIMIDGRGNAIITDFGLAALAIDLEQRTEVAGTPAYMAPEQLSGGKATQLSDLYSLGLILYEIFTGKRRFSGRSVEEMQRLHESSDPSTVSREGKSVDPIILQVIMRCLEPDPADRPRSIHAVIAALPGADPLQAAIEAGETPSPEMVAAAGRTGTISPRIGVPILILTLVALFGVVWLKDRTEIHGIRDLPLHPRVLENRAHQILELVRFEGIRADSNYFFVTDDDFFELPLSERSGFDPASVNPPPISFYYRQSPQELIPLAGYRRDRRVIPSDPPINVPGMAQVYLSPEGRLLLLLIVPAENDLKRDATVPELSWESLFAEAGLDFSSARTIDPTTVAPVDVDERLTWRASYVDQPEREVIVNGGRFGSKVVWFEILSPWTEATLAQLRPPRVTIADTLITIMIALAILSGVWLARRNLRRGRGDRVGATRLGFVLFVALALGLVLRADHVTSVAVEWHLLVDRISVALFRATMIGVLYLAIEPYLRRRWPALLVSWSRLLAKRVRDPLVGRDIMLGVAAATLMSLVYFGAQLFAEATLLGSVQSTLTSARQTTATTLLTVASGVLPAFVLTTLLIGLSILLRSRLAGALVTFGVLSVLAMLAEPGSPLVATLVNPFFSALVVYRLGLLATTAYMAALHLMLHPMTLDTTAFFFPVTLIPVLTILGLLIWGFTTAVSIRDDHYVRENPLEPAL